MRKIVFSRSFFLLLLGFFTVQISWSKTENHVQIDSSILQVISRYETLAKNAVTHKDSLNLINRVLAESNSHRYRGNYDRAFDLIWDANLLSEHYGLSDMQNQINRALGILYDIYNKDSLALHHLNLALEQSKILVQKDSTTLNQLVSSYFSVSTFWRDREEFERALLYLDSSEIVTNYQKDLPYVITDKGFCNLKLGNLNEAEKFLRKGSQFLKKSNSPYQVQNQYFLGELMLERYEYDSALVYLNKSLRLMEQMNTHTEIKPELLERISEVYVIKGDLLAALNSMKASKRSYEKLFSATSDHNQRLFEINNRYEVELADNRKVITEQKGVIEQKSRKLFWLFVVFGFTIVTGLGVYLFFYQQNRYKKLSLIAEMDSEKSKAILDVKSRELTAYAVKMIDMEDTMQNLMDELKNVAPDSYKKYENANSKGSVNAWEEFNKRFTEVNTHFYETLCAKHPNLSSTELKHCALIKLNFNSYEMSKILNISQRSVHTSRYRIRKKLGLNSNSSLTSYIGRI